MMQVLTANNHNAERLYAVISVLRFQTIGIDLKWEKARFTHLKIYPEL